MLPFNRFAQNGAVVVLRSGAAGIPGVKLGNSVSVSVKTASFGTSSSSPSGPLPTPLSQHNNVSSTSPVIQVFNIQKSNSLQQSVPHRRYSSDLERPKNKSDEIHLDLIGKPKKIDEDEVRWFHPSPTERMENPAYTYLKNHPEYQTLFFQHEVYSRLMTEDGRLTAEGEETVNPAVKAFIDLCNSNPDAFITDPKYEPVFADLISQASKLTDVELLLVFYNFRRFPKKPKAKDKDYRKIWQPLDEICYTRVIDRKWSLEYIFNMADLIYSAGLATESKFHWHLVKMLYRRVDHLSREEFIRMMFCFGGVKSLPDSLSIYNIEYNLPKFIDDLTPEEVAVVSVGFLRTKTMVHNKDVLEKMLRIIAQESSRTSSPSISAVSKAVTLSSRTIANSPDMTYEFFDAFVPEIPRIDIHACASLVLLALKTRVEHEEMLMEIVKKLEGNVNVMRSKDLEYISAGLVNFNIDCDSLYREIVEDFRTRVMNMPLKSFCNVHGRSFIHILHHLSHKNIYPNDLISLALSDEFLDRTFGRSMYTYPQEVLLLDICTGLEAEGYEGPRLSEKYRGFLTKKNMLWIADEEKVTTSEYQKIARYMLELCISSLGGPEYSHLCNVVPPFRTIGAVYCIDKNTQEPVPIPEDFASIDDFNIKYIPEGADNLKFHAFVLFPGSHYAINTLKPNGIAEMHCRQMEKMGYVVHPLYLGHTVNGPDEMREAISKVLGRPVLLQSEAKE